MSEQYILPNAKSKAIKAFMKGFTGCSVTGLAYGGVGWNVNSRACYNGLMG